MKRGSRVARIFPNAAPEAMLLTGFLKFTWLKMLKYSFRNWILPHRSESGKSLKSAKSQLT